jgi:nucleoside phosphorylase
MNSCYIVALKDEVNSINSINDLPVFYSGIGKLNSILLLHRLAIKGYNNFINIGSCGSKNYKIGELLKVGLAYEDFDARPLLEYGKSSSNHIDKHILIDKTSNISCFSTDNFYDNNYDTRYSNEYINMINTCSIFDMECYAQAKFCISNNFGYQSYKWVSDDGNSHDWLNNTKIGFEKYINTYSNNI